MLDNYFLTSCFFLNIGVEIRDYIQQLYFFVENQLIFSVEHIHITKFLKKIVIVDDSMIFYYKPKKHNFKHNVQYNYLKSN